MCTGQVSQRRCRTPNVQHASTHYVTSMSSNVLRGSDARERHEQGAFCICGSRILRQMCMWLHPSTLLQITVACILSPTINANPAQPKIGVTHADLSIEYMIRSPAISTKSSSCTMKMKPSFLVSALFIDSHPNGVHRSNKVTVDDSCVVNTDTIDVWIVPVVTESK